MRTGGDFHQDLKKDLKQPEFKAIFEKERARLDLSEQLKKRLKASKLSVRKVAAMMGTSKSQVDRMINDAKANLNINTLIKFAAVLGKRVEITLR